MTPEEYSAYKHQNFPATRKEHRVPGETLLWYGKDQQEKDTTPEVMTLHLTPDQHSWQDVDVSYSWNSMGYRGPEPNKHADRKMLLAGGSMVLGVGLPLELTLAEVLARHYDADYLNISDYDSLTELTEPLQTLGVDYNPDYVIIGDTRFVVENNWLMAFIKQNLKQHQLELKKQDLQFFQETFDRTNRDVLNVFSGYVQSLFPNAKVLFLVAPRKNFKFETGLKNQVCIDKSMMVDLSRDGAHPGPESIKLIAEKIISKLDEKE
jgi:hypothetical protein